MRASIRAWESSFAGSWGLFALAALPGSLTASWGLIRLSPHLSPLDFAEWAFLVVATTVVGSMSQLGLKPGYMQYVTDHGKEARTPGLRAAMALMFATGSIAGLCLSIGFYTAAQYGLWNNTAVLPWLIPMMAIGNVTMMLHTDLRILGRSSVIATIAFVQVPIFMGLLEISLRALEHPLASLYAANTAVTLIFALAIAVYGGVLKARTMDRVFLKWAVALGLPAMAALLSKYAADLTVSASFRWLAPEHEAGLYGLATRLAEPLMGLYIASFQMAWGAFVYGWIKADTSAQTVHMYAYRSWWYALGAVPVGVVLASLVWWYTQTPFAFNDVMLFFAMCLSRAMAFGVSSPLGFGQTIRRNYTRGFQIHALELGLTALMVPLALLAWGAQAALLFAAALPWITVILLLRYSNSTVAALHTLSPPVSPRATGSPI